MTNENDNGEPMDDEDGFVAPKGRFDMPLPDPLAEMPSDTKADLRYRSGSGKVTTDFEIALSDDMVRADNRKIEIDEFVSGTLNGGGDAPLILDTEKGDIRLLKRMRTPTH